MNEGVRFFGVRHLSPAGSFHLLKLLEEVKPEIVLVEGPSDASPLIPQLFLREARPPLAILAYTNTLPARSILYPLSSYSPEYTALKWAVEKGARAEFIDLPAEVFLALKKLEEEEEKEEEKPKERVNFYERFARAAGYSDYETYWEAEFEHNLNPESYERAILEFGKSFRELEGADKENLLREAFMRGRIKEALEGGVKPDKIVAVTGAFHTPALTEETLLTNKELANLPKSSCNLTLMPYSNLRLSSRTGYGAGNSSPAYFGMLWSEINSKGGTSAISEEFLTATARALRQYGTFRSTAEVIEAVALAKGLASLNNRGAPTLSELRSAAVTLFGQGELSVVAKALNASEVGTEIGFLPEGASRTAVQEDFYKQIKALGLEKYVSSVAQTLTLDLRENRDVKAESAAWKDLRRSNFLFRLQTLDVSFAALGDGGQDRATWKELWELKWTTEAEIELAESSLLGESVEIAAVNKLAERLNNVRSVAEVTLIIKEAMFCGMQGVLERAAQALSEFAVETDSFEALSKAVSELSATLSYGDIRRVDVKAVPPLLTKLFFRGVLTAKEGAKIPKGSAREAFDSFNMFNRAALTHYEIVDDEAWLSVLKEIAESDNVSPEISGYSAAILLERNLLEPAELEIMLSRRLSPGIDAKAGSGWFEGFAERNKYGILSRGMVWRILDEYLSSLEEEEFKTALVYLRRTFSKFSAEEARLATDNLGKIWGLKAEVTENKLLSELNSNEQKTLEEINDFNFDDI